MEHKRIAALHDISGFGRGSMTTAIAVCAAAGIQCCPLVGAVLSAHTAYPDVHIRDLTADLPATVENWKQIGCRFDGLYSGYMSDMAQSQSMLYLKEHCAKPGSLLLVDPVMGDNGKAYAGAFGPTFARQMADYCVRADVITPNLTEAAMLLGEAPDAWRDEPAFVSRYLERLGALGPFAVVITGIHDGKGQVGAAFRTQTGASGLILRPQVDAYFPGTGDLFASVLLTALLRRPGELAFAVERAVDFVYRCVERTHQAGTPPIDGVLLEAMLPALFPAQEEQGQ